MANSAERANQPLSDFFEYVRADRQIVNRAYNDSITINKQTGLSLRAANSSFKDISIKRGGFRTIHLFQCDFNNLIIDEGDNLGSITLENCAYSSIKINSSIFQELKVISCEVGSNIMVENVGLSKLLIHNTSIPNISLGVTSPTQIKLTNETKTRKETGLMHITSLVGDSLFSAVNGKIGQISIDNCDQQSRISMGNVTINRLQINEGALSSLDLENCNITQINFEAIELPNLQITDGDFGTILLGQSNVNKYQIEKKDNSLASLPIEHLIIRQPNLIHNSIINVKGVDCMSLSLNGLKNNHGTLIVTDTIVNELFSIEFASLGNSKFSNLNLKRCKAIKTLNASFTESKFFNVQWPSTYRIHEYEKEIDACETSDQKISKFFYPLRESYRQLIAVSNKELNKIDALFFQKQELRIYFEIIKFEKWKSWSNFQDFLVLGSNKLFSDFGQNIWLPLKWWIPIHLILFTLLISNHELGVSMVSPKEHEWEFFWDGVGIFLNLLSPVHSSEINKVSIFGITDFLMRLTSGYFLFYFISATRKFHLK